MLYKYRKFIVLGLILIVLGIAGFMYYSLFIFHITSTTPDSGSVSRYAPVLRVHFNKELTDEKIEITGDVVKSIEVKPEDKTIVVYLNDLDTTKNADYRFTITSVSSKSGDTLKNKVVSFHTKNIPFSELSAEDQKIILDAQQEKKASLYSDVIFESLPYSTLTYSIDAREPVSDVPGVKVIITATLSAADVRTDRAGAIERAYTEARAYLSSLKGVSLPNYDVQYEVTEPSLY